MNAETLERILLELRAAVTGKKFGKIFQLSRFEMAIDFRLPDSSYLFVSVEPADPRLYLIRRRLRDLEKQSGNPPNFAMMLRKRLSGAMVDRIERFPDERVIRFDLSAVDELGDHRDFALLVQLTGRSANLFLADSNLLIIDTWRESSGDGQSIGDRYSPPLRQDARSSVQTKHGEIQPVSKLIDGSLSEQLDSYYLDKAADKKFLSLAQSARSKLKQEISKREKVLNRLNEDLDRHGDADKWKRFGDLLLANVATARREGGRIFVTDFYDEDLSEIAVESDENLSITAAAEEFFRKYTKAKNAGREIAKRLKAVTSELDALRAKQELLERAVEARDENYFSDGSAERPSTKAERRKAAESNSGVRTFVSSDGFEILVGKKAKDNDYLTFRIAKSLDTWMHAADYPGSHVVIRNPNRQEIPHRSLLEAARLAAFYSRGKAQTKAAVHYTQKKFVNKPRGAAPGLVSLASFKTILVEPGVPDFEATR